MTYRFDQYKGVYNDWRLGDVTPQMTMLANTGECTDLVSLAIEIRTTNQWVQDQAAHWEGDKFFALNLTDEILRLTAFEQAVRERSKRPRYPSWRTTFISFLLVLVISCGITGLIGYANGKYDGQRDRCEEDEPCWNCHTDGNMICGPGVE